MQLHHFHAELGRGIHLFQRRIDEQTDANPGSLQPPDGWLEFLALRSHVQAPFRGNLFTFFRYQADLFWFNAQRDVHDLLRVAHLQI